uniref:Exonuclease domain-containing protein n=1 Tax=Oryza rufipogon TaxID=4529 RepID=A0A0E0QYY0_ORYRU
MSYTSMEEGEGSSRVMVEEEPKIAFFDVETSMPRGPRERRTLLEFGSIFLCPRQLVEVAEPFVTLVRPSDLGVVTEELERKGITRGALEDAPPFYDVADNIHNALHGRIWAGHNIISFDSEIIREAFAEIGRSPPEPKGMIDTLPLLTQTFGRRAGNMKMASLANYFGLGRQSHRSLDDVRMNLEVLKYCATVLFLEASLPGVLTVENLVERAITRSQANGAASPEVPKPVARIPTIVSGEAATYGTDIYQKEASGNIQKLVFSKVDVAELDSWFVRGNMVDAFFSLELYDYEENAGIRLVAKKLVVQSK